MKNTKLKYCRRKWSGSFEVGKPQQPALVVPHTFQLDPQEASQCRCRDHLNKISYANMCKSILPKYKAF